MSERSTNSAGIDLSRVPSLCAIARGDEVDLLDPVTDFGSLINELIEGVYTVTATALASSQTGSMGGVTFLDGPSPLGVFHDSSTYTYVGDELGITVVGPESSWVQVFRRNG